MDEQPVTPLEQLSAVVQRSARRPEWYRSTTGKGWNLNNLVNVWPRDGLFMVQPGLGYVQRCDSAELAVKLAELLA